MGGSRNFKIIHFYTSKPLYIAILEDLKQKINSLKSIGLKYAITSTTLWKGGINEVITLLNFENRKGLKTIQNIFTSIDMPDYYKKKLQSDSTSDKEILGIFRTFGVDGIVSEIDNFNEFFKKQTSTLPTVQTYF